MVGFSADKWKIDFRIALEPHGRYERMRRNGVLKGPRLLAKQPTVNHVS